MFHVEQFKKLIVQEPHMKKLLLLLALLPLPLLAQQTPERDQLTATSAQVAAKSYTGRHNESYQGASLSHVFEFHFDTPPTYTYTITPCMRGGACFAPVTASVSANTAIRLTDILADYYTVAVTWSGGTVTTFQVNILAVPQA
jgi:hypothetical protein